MMEVRYQVIIADPPWAYRVGGGVHGDVDEQYTVMPYASIAAIPVREFAADNAVLAMWGTWPKLNEGVALMAAWGFEYVTGFPWVKTMPAAGTIRRGIGFWTMSASELVLIGRRGEPKKAGKPAPVMGLLIGEDRQFYAPAREHSRKPYGIHDWLAEMFNGPYLELFARRERPGWSTWGGDTGFHLSASGVERVGVAKALTQAGLFDEVTS